MNETDDREPEASRAEVAAAADLERALGGGHPSSGAAELLRLFDRVRATAGPVEPLAPAAAESAVEAAIRTMSGRAGPRSRGRWPASRWVAGVATLAAAAAVLVIVVPMATTGGRELPPEAVVGPTDALFSGPFPEGQSAAERADTIVAARTRGYFAALAAGR